MRIVVDTGIFSASISRLRRQRFETEIALMAGNQIFLAATTVSETPLRGDSSPGGARPGASALEESIQATTVVPVSKKLLTTIAELRFACRRAGHPLHDRSHADDLWIAASAAHINAPLLTTDNVFEDTPGRTLYK